ncbi:MAG: ferric reductase-like transmembrane domain-containing protein [Phycisphaerales bacterium]
MSVSYTWVGWNRQKRIYDVVMVSSAALFIALFIVVARAVEPPGQGLSDVQLLIRALGVAAIVLLHIILCIGPLARFDRRLLPLLYNRRHLGVFTFFVALAHASLSLIWYHGFGNVASPVSLLQSNTNFRSISQFPFELLGLLALIILFLMAATSHDFWLKNLSPRVWKSLHMLVYVAYAALVLHVALGVLQHETSPVLAAALGLGVLLVGSLHLTAGWCESLRDTPLNIESTNDDARADAWVDVGAVDQIPNERGRVVCLRDPAGGHAERIAVFKYDGKVSAVSNVCEHQGGPLGEGKIVAGCITCPWHGYQYLPGSGQSPPPFTEKIKTYQVRIESRRVLVNPRALPPGTPVPPALIPEVADA